MTYDLTALPPPRLNCGHGKKTIMYLDNSRETGGEREIERERERGWIER